MANGEWRMASDGKAALHSQLRFDNSFLRKIIQYSSQVTFLPCLHRVGVIEIEDKGKGTRWRDGEMENRQESEMEKRTMRWYDVDPRWQEGESAKSRDCG